MRWLIVEDALRDRKGHWFEYLGTFARELRALDDEVTFPGRSGGRAVSRRAIKGETGPAGFHLAPHGRQCGCFAALSARAGSCVGKPIAPLKNI
ncbi:MAG: hypothetical protein WDN00_08545 [Limisphaerales bacterium]